MSGLVRARRGWLRTAYGAAGDIDVPTTGPPLDPRAAQRLLAIACSYADATDAKGQYRPSHAHGVADLVTRMASYLGITGTPAARIRIAALMHDVGKLYTPDSILLKPAKLTGVEQEQMRRHPAEGYTTLRGMDLTDEAIWVLHHHERIDGTGYPYGISGTAIPLPSRLIAVADAYNCMRSDRVYRRALSAGDAMQELVDGTGSQFCPVSVEALIDAISRGRVLLER